jgi:nucleoside-diphosphate-sugar epimerase
MAVLQNTTIALIGCGDIGCRLAPLLIAAGATVHGFRRTISALPANIIAHSIDVQNPNSLAILNDITFDYAIITLSPSEMSELAYKTTYVNGLKNILSALNFSALKKLFWVSSTSVYGQSDGSDVDEQSNTEPTRFSGQYQLEAEQLLSDLDENACIVRFAGIYREGKHRLVEQIKAGKLSSTINNDYITNRIHIADCVGVLAHLITLDASGNKLKPIYLGVDNAPVNYSEVVHWLAQELNIELSADGEQQTPRVGSKRCLNTQLRDSGYRFIYPSYKEGFRTILNQ